MKEKELMSPDELKRALDYREGDIVQIRADGELHSGCIGRIIAIKPVKTKRSNHLNYVVKLADNEAITVQFFRIRLIRGAESDEDVPKEKSLFWPRDDVIYY